MRNLFLISVLCTFLASRAQHVEINGKVVNDKGEPLTCATINVKGKMGGTCTDYNGRFRIALTAGDSIQISHVGYSEFTYSTRKAGSIEIAMKSQPFLVLEKKSRVVLSEQNFGRGILTAETLNDQVIPNAKWDSIMANPLTFMRVEIGPALNPTRSRDTAFSGGINIRQAKRKGVLELGFIVSKDKSIEHIRVLKSYSKKVDERIMENLESAFNCVPAIQNGRRVDVECKVSLQVYGQEGRVRVEIIDPSWKN